MIMKYPCDTVRDLLPLYYDDVCSESSKKVVEEHLSECDSCTEVMKKISNKTYDNRLQKEKEHIVEKRTKFIKRKSLAIGLGFGSILTIPIIVCLIINLATSHVLDWFFIVLSALMVLASLTVVPLVAETKKVLWTLTSFTSSLMILLLSCCIYTNGNWFFVASIPTLFGLSVLFAPLAAHQLPLKGFAKQNKGLIVMTIDTILLYSVIVTCGLYSNYVNYWASALLITTVIVIFIWVLFAIIRYLKVNGLIKAGVCTIISGILLSLIYDIVNWILSGAWQISMSQANLVKWNSNELINANVYLLFLILGCIVGFILLFSGFIKHINNKKSN